MQNENNTRGPIEPLAGSAPTNSLVRPLAGYLLNSRPHPTIGEKSDRLHCLPLYRKTEIRRSPVDEEISTIYRPLFAVVLYISRWLR